MASKLAKAVLNRIAHDIEVPLLKQARAGVIEECGNRQAKNEGILNDQEYIDWYLSSHLEIAAPEMSLALERLFSGYWGLNYVTETHSSLDFEKSHLVDDLLIQPTPTIRDQL